MSWRHRIHKALDPALDIEIEDERYLGDTVQHRAAAVLIPITDRAEPGVILTQRPTWLRSHAGQAATRLSLLQPVKEPYPMGVNWPDIGARAALALRGA